MAKQLNVSLAFTADTSKAKKDIQDLQSQLTNLIQIGNKQDSTLGLSKSIQNATQKAAELKSILSSAINTNTGNLDLSKFSESLQRSNRSLSDYQKALSSLGPEGNKAFLSLTQSINKAEVPLKRTNGLISELWTTLKNTARWQLSSSVLHSFMGSLQSAYGYAQNLNQSLNNIRIVTGYGADEMAKFAESANKAAQTLSTTTTSYTDAALIYYQQGIRDQEEIASRTETTIKLANVSRQSAEEVSSQMTAIWNNFDDGSHSLEYYADVITALGATTASSSQEIAKGMQQFAAVAETVGLSYEYAAASLATIVATTRQSESTVGNGLRTIFSRLEGLKLGDTLEDGTDLNKYSAALATIGVDIKDVSGDLKDMDTILEETASKWDTLDKAQKVAFATTVGGVRQYTNLIALLDNWDMVQENLNTARNSEGTLNQQAETYAESWEAARKRVKSAAEDIYDSLIDEDFFIAIDNGLAKFLNQISNLIKGLGGLKGVLATVLTLVSQLFNNQISQSLDNMIYSLKMSSEKGRQSIINDKKRVNDLMINSSIDADTTSGSATAFAFEQQGIASNLVLENVSKMSVLEKEVAQQLLDQNATLAEETISLGEQLEQQQAISNTLEKRTNIFAKNAIQNGGSADPKSFIAGYEVLVNNLKNANQQYYNLEAAVKRISAIKPKIENIDKFKTTISSLQEQASNAGLSLEEAFGDKGAKAIEKLNNIITTTPNDINAIIDAQQNLNSVLDGNLTHIDFLEERLRTLLTNAGVAPQQIDSIINNLKTSYEDLGVKTSELAESQERLKNNTNGLKTFLGQINGESMTLSSSMISLFGTITSLSMAINTLKGIGQVWSDEDTSILDKVLSTTMALGIAIPMLTRALSQENIQKTASALASISMAISDQTATAMSIGATVARKAESLGLSENTAAKLANVAATLALHAPLIAIIAALGALVGIIYAVNKAHNKSADDAKKASKAAEGLKEQYQKTKESYEELKKSIEDHDNAVKAIDKLKHGTEEWRDAIQEANEKVLELIGNYPQLAAAVNRSEDGILTIDQKSSAHQAYLDAEKKRMNSSFAGSTAGNIIANNANYTNDLVQAGRKMWYQSGTTNMQGEEIANYSQVSEAQLRQAVELFNKDKSLFVEGQENKLAEALNTTNTNLCKTLISNISAIEKLSTELSANTTANQLAAEQIGMAAFKEQNSNIDDKYVQAVSGMLGGNYQEALERANNKWMDNGKFGSGPSDEAAQQEYAKEMGYTWKKNLGNNMGRYTDDKGQTIEIDDAVAREYLTVRDATAEISENLDSAKQAINDLQRGSQNLSKELGKDTDTFALLTGGNNGQDFNFSEYSEEQVSALRKSLRDAAGDDEWISTEEFYQNFGISDEYAQSKGYENAVAYCTAMVNGVENYTHDVKYKNILDSLMPTAKPFEEASANYNTITSAGSKITNDNYILDDKSYQELEAAGIAVDQYFEQMADGTHLLTSSVSDFKSVIDSVANSELYAAQANQEKITGSLEAYSASGGISSLLTDQDKNNILQFSGVSPEDIANIQMIEDSMARMDAYAEKFKELGLTGDIEKINELLQQSADETQKIQDAIENSQFKDKVTDSGLDLEETIEYSKYLQRLAKNEEDAYIGADKLSEELIDNDQAAKSLSLQVQKMNKGVESLSKNWKNWSDMLKNSSKGSKEYYDALDDTKGALSDLLDISEDFIDDEFVDSLANNTDSMKLMEEAAKGDGDAIDALRQKTLDNLILNLEINSEDLDNNTLLERVHGLQDMLDEMGPIEAGATIDTSGLDAGEAEFIAALNQLIADAGMGKEAVNAMLSGMGFTANFATEPQKVMRKEPDEVTTHVRKVSKGILPIEGGGSVEEYDMITTTETKPGKEVPGTIDASSMITTEPGTTVVPKINSLTKNASGSANNSSSSNKGGSGGGKGGGGGGGGSSKPAKKKDVTKKNDEKEIDRYIKINQQLAQKEHENTLLNTKLNSTSGQSAIKVMKEQLAILKQQKGLYGELAKEAENYRVKDLEKLKKDFADLNFQIDPSDGMLMNYEALLKEQTDLYNKVYNEWTEKIIAAEKAYNDQIEILGEAATEEALKPWLEAIEKIKEESKDPLREAEEKYELFKKDTDKYNDSVEQARKAAEEAAAKELEAYNQELEIIAKGVELKIKVDDADLQYLEFLLKQIGEGADKALDRMANYTQSIEDNMSKIEKYQDGLSEVLEHAGIDFDDLLAGDIDDLGSFNEEDLAKVEEYRDALISCGEQLIELRKTLLNEVSEAFDEFNSDLDRAVDKIEHLKTFTQTYKNLVDIVGKDVLDPTGQTTIMLARTTYTQAESNTKALQDQLDYQLSAIDDYNRVIAELQADNANGQHDDTIKEFKNQLKEAEDAYAATQEEWLSSWEETVQAAADIYEAELNQIIEDFGKSITGLAGSLEDLSQQYERTKDLQDMYVDDYEKIYQLSKLNRDINKSIDDTDNIRSKQRLRDLQSQINDLQASENEMSEYELENLRRRYELELASLQLEESREAKSQVRMMRDNEGNWGYVYTADETAVEEAEQNYEDKLYAMQKANSEYIESLEAEIIRIEQEWADALAEIKVQDYASYEEYKAAIDACNDYYSTKLDQTYDQMDIVMTENKKLYDEDWARYSAATGYKISEDERYIDNFNETNLAQITGYQTIEDAMRDYHRAIGEDIDGSALEMGDAVDSVTNRMSDAYDEWYRRTDEALVLGGTSMETYAQDVEEYINGDGGIVDQTIDAQEAVDEMAQEYDDKFTEIIDYAEEFAMDFDSVIQDIIESCNEAIEAIQRLLEAMAEAADTDFEPDGGMMEPDDYEWVNLKEGTGDYDWHYRSKSTGQDKIGNFDADYTHDGTTYRASYKTDASGSILASDTNFEHNGKFGMINERIVNSMDNNTKATQSLSNNIGDWARAQGYAVVGMASGGYTGSWGSQGKLAMLHEKELVLNAEDTSNILSAIDMVRDISRIIDLTASSTSGMLSNLFNAKVSTGSSNFEQTVTIQADFPNVQNRSEIEEAFDNLVNKAAQYANRKI